MTPSKTSKPFLLLLCYCSFMLLEACTPDEDCSNFVNLPYVTFDSMEAIPNALSFDSSSDELAIEIKLNGVEYVAYNALPKAKWFSTSMYGCTPVPAGFDGLKDPLMAMDITASEDFDAEHSAGDLLNDLFELDADFVNTDANLAALIASNKINEVFYNGNEFPSFILKEAYPTNAGIYNFTVKLVFENGDPITLTLDPITFN